METRKLTDNRLR